MQALRQWSFLKVVMVSGGWVLLCLLVTVGWALFQFRTLLTSTSSGSGGIGAVSTSISVLTLLIPAAPPILLFVAWLVARLS